MACKIPNCPDVTKCDRPGVCLAVEPADRLNTLLEAAETHEHMPPIKGYLAFKQAAAEVGYAVAVHGSLRRDFDLIAVPWREDAVGNVALMQHLAKRVPEILRKAMRLVGHGGKPLGRWSSFWAIDDWSKNIDLSIAPGGSGGGEIETWFLKQLSPPPKVKT
jgi:hypothetical protein